MSADVKNSVFCENVAKKRCFCSWLLGCLKGSLGLVLSADVITSAEDLEPQPM